MTVSDAMSRNLEKIRVRVNNWVQGNGYGPRGFPKNSAKHDVIFLLRCISDLVEERKEMQVRIAELEVYEEWEMIGDPAGLGGPSVSSSLRARDAAQADAENTRHQLDWANERIRYLENNIRSHKRVCPMFRGPEGGERWATATQSPPS